VNGKIILKIVTIIVQISLLMLKILVWMSLLKFNIGSFNFVCDFFNDYYPFVYS